MPNKDGTGPTGQGSRTGRGRSGRGRGSGRGQGGSDKCECPNCGHVEPHKRGVPCSEVKCPECGTLMRGKFCK